MAVQSSNLKVSTNLLDNFHVKSNYNHYTALGQAFAFLLLAGAWTTIVFTVASAAGLSHSWLVPALLTKVVPSLFPELATATIPGIDAPLLKTAAEMAEYLAPTIVVATIIPVNALFMVLCERKFLALLTVRTGPTDVGPNGFLQTFADALKLLFKEDITPAGADTLLFTLAPALFFAPAMVVFMPLLSVATNNAGIFASTNMDVGILFILGIASLGTMSLVMGGWASNNKYSLIGGLRASAQAISYEIPMVLSMIAIVLMAGSVNLVEVSDKQAGGLMNWNVFGNGQTANLYNLIASNYGDLALGLKSIAFVTLCALLFIIFVVASTAEVNRIPFDLPEAESELVSGYNTEFTGMKFALFFLAEYTNLFIASGLAAVLFLGGSHLPISAEAEQALYATFSGVDIQLPVIGTFHGLLADLDFSWIISGVTFITKIYLMFCLSIWIRATLPRLRQDQLMEFGWKYLIPLTLGCIFVMALLVESLGI